MPPHERLAQSGMASAAGRIGPRGAGLRDSRDVKSDTDLGLLLAELSPRQRPGQYVFVVADEAKPVAGWTATSGAEGPRGWRSALIQELSEPGRQGRVKHRILGVTAVR